MTYRYRKIGSFLVRVDRPLVDALRIFWCGYDRFGLDTLGMSRSFTRRVMKAVALGRFRSRDSASFVSLPVFAHVGMQVHHGHKLFDFDRSEVTKVFDVSFSSQQAAEEIAASKKADRVPSAPRYLRASDDSRWYTEEFIRGTHATKLVAANSSDYRRFYADAERCLLDLVNSNQPESLPVQKHVNLLADNSFRARWLEAGATSDEVDQISDYTERLRAWLIENSEADQLQLVLTHGDFSLVNAIATDGGLRFIDWEGVRHGGIYSDIYNFVLVERYYGRTSPEYVSEAREFFDRYRKSVLVRYPELRRAASVTDRFARRLYYLERTRLLIERDVTPNLRQVTRKSIAMFRQFDSDMGDIPV